MNQPTQPTPEDREAVGVAQVAFVHALLEIETILQDTPERSDFVDDLAQQQDEALAEIHRVSQSALKIARDDTSSGLTAQAPREETGFQDCVKRWMGDTFPPEVSSVQIERALRFLEGSTELCL